MAYSRSTALNRWLGERRLNIDLIAEAHVDVGQVAGPRRPLEVGRPLAHAYLIRMLAEFQGFTRDVYDAAVEHLVTVADTPPHIGALLTTAMTRGRSIDTGNATMSALRTDLTRLGLRNVEAKLAASDGHWARPTGTDPPRYIALTNLRNALAHGNQRQVAELRSQGTLDTVTWARNQLPVLNRGARALDRVVWDHLNARTGVPPW